MDVKNPFVQTIVTVISVQKMVACATTDSRVLDVNSRHARVQCCQMMVRATYHVLDTVIVYTDLVTATQISPVRAVLSVKET